MLHHICWAFGLWPNDSIDPHKFFWTSRYGWCWNLYAHRTTNGYQPGPTQTATNLNANITNPLINGINQIAGGCLTCHEWVWYQLERQAGCNLGLAWTECRYITVVVHQELRVLPLRVQQLSYQDVLIEFDSAVDVEWVAQKLLRMEWWMSAQCYLECIPCSGEDSLWEFRGGGWCPPWMDLEWIDLSRHGPVTPQMLQSSTIPKLWGSTIPGGHPKWSEHHHIGLVALGPPT